MKHPMVEESRYSMVPRPDVPRSAFTNRSFHKTTFQESTLVPIYVREILPGDHVHLNMDILARLAVPIVPVMDNLVLQSYFFYVPNRIVWSNWQKFMGQVAAGETTVYLTPYVTVAHADLVIGNIWDYLGITNNNAGAGTGNDLQVSAFVPRSVNMIWNQYFRDQDLQAAQVENLGDGPDSSADYGMYSVAKFHDYFTSARPWPQKPINETIAPQSTNLSTLAEGQSFWMHGAAGKVPVSGLGVPAASTVVNPNLILETGSRTDDWSTPGAFRTTEQPFYMRQAYRAGAGTGYPDVVVLVNDIRTAFMVQNMLEKMARGGTRYTEFLTEQFGVRSPDARLQRPEYLGGGRSVITVNPVAQTSGTGASGTTTPLGQLSATAYVAGTKHGFSQAFVEHGHVIGFVCVRSDQTYQQGMHRMWKRRTQNDFYLPAMAHLPEQPIMSYEIYSDGGANDLGVFGYQMRWDEYRTEQSRTSGYFRSTVGTPLDMWHYAVKYASRPTLNGTTFIPDATPLSRVMQVSAPYTAHIMADAMFTTTLVRPMPMFSVPGFGARF